MLDNTCETCKHFFRHYVKNGKSKFAPISEGHCGHPRLKCRRIDTPACEKFSLRKSDT